ncbi:hypothetical protein Tco_0985005 [Tanacetum coccineum]
MTVGVRKPKAQWTDNERKAANLDQRLKSLIMSVLPDDQINSVINCETAKSTWEDLILYHEGPSDVKENRVKNQGLIAEAYEWDEEEVSSNDNEIVEVKYSWHLQTMKVLLLAKKVPEMMNGLRSP